MSGITKIAKESGISLSGSLIGLVLNYLLLMILTRFLTPDEFGTFVLAQSIINIALIFVLIGLPKALDRFIPFFNIEGAKGKIKSLIQSVIRIMLILSLVIGILIFVGAEYVSSYLPKYTSFSTIIRAMIFSLPLLAYIQVVSSVFAGFKEMRYQVYLRRIAFPFLEVLVAGLLLIFGMGIMEWVWGYVISLMGTVILAFYYYHKGVRVKLAGVIPQKVSLRMILSYSWPLSINNVIMIILGQIGIILLGYYRMPAETGAFRVYVYLVSFLSLIMSSFAQIYKPVISESVAKNDIHEIKETYRRVSKWIFLINSFGVLILIMIGADVIRLFFTDDYLIMPVALVILASGVYLNSTFGPEGMTLEAYGKTKLSLLNALIMLVINVGLCFLLIPRYGVTGAAMASAMSVFAGGVAGLIEIYFLYRLQPFNFHYLKYLGALMIPAALLYVGKLVFGSINIAELILLMVIPTVVYFVGLSITKTFDTLDREMFNKILSRVSMNKKQ